MANITTHEFKSWKDLSTFIDKTFTHFNNFIFRGHADANWKLESTLARSINKTYPNEKNIQNLIDKHFNSFKINIRGKSKIDFQNIDDDELWATGQHFGLLLLYLILQSHLMLHYFLHYKAILFLVKDVFGQ